MVKQAARRGDDNLGALRQLLDLRRDADAAKDQDGAHMRQMLAVGAHTFLNLCREFTRRHQHQRTLSFIAKNLDGALPEAGRHDAADATLLASVAEATTAFREAFADLGLSHATEADRKSTRLNSRH